MALLHFQEEHHFDYKNGKILDRESNRFKRNINYYYIKTNKIQSWQKQVRPCRNVDNKKMYCINHETITDVILNFDITYSSYPAKKCKIL